MNPMCNRLIFCVLVLLFTVCNFSDAEEPHLLVEVHLFPPFVMGSEGRYSGFDIDIWEAIAADLGLKFQYHQVGMLDDIFQDLSHGKADVAIAGLSITEKREKLVDFSYRYIEAGLHILVNREVEPSIFRAIKSISTPVVLKITLGLIAFCLFFTHLVWWAERKKDEPNDKYFPAIFEWLWWVQVTIATVGYGDKYPRKWWGRIIAILVMYTGIGLFVYFTAQLSSSLTLQELKSDISSPKDLIGKSVATKKGSTSVSALEKLGVDERDVYQMDKIEQAYYKLLVGKVDAVVFDSPNLLHYVTNEGKGKVAIAGSLFYFQDYGIALQQGSPLREQVNRSLLKLRESGKYDIIYKKWFGESSNWVGG